VSDLAMHTIGALTILLSLARVLADLLSR